MSTPALAALAASTSRDLPYRQMFSASPSATTALPAPRPRDIQKLHSRHKLILRLRVLGRTNVQIAQILGMSAEHISTIVNSPVFMEEEQRLHRDSDKGVVAVQSQIGRLMPLAVDVFERILTEEEPDVSLKERMVAATEILDRGGAAKVHKTQNTVAVLTEHDIMRIKERAAAARAESIDATPMMTVMEERSADHDA